MLNVNKKVFNTNINTNQLLELEITRNENLLRK